MNTRHFKTELAAYLSSGLTEVQRRQVDEHLAECEKCRQALSKAKSKQSRFRREALKSATADKVPNLFLSRLERQVPGNRRRFPFMWVGLGLIIIGVAVVLTRHDWQHFQFPTPSREVSSSSATVVQPTTSAEAPSAASVVAIANPLAVSSATVVPVVPVTAAETSESQALGQWKGEDSQIKEYREVVIRGRAAWRTLWSEMGKGDAPPHINFYSYIVVGVFAGQKNSKGYEVTLLPSRETGDELVVPVRVRSAATEVASAAPSYPYQLMVIPRTAKPIRFSKKAAAGA